eukprot:scaffold448523_cov142-Attheya_sp.AAC.1
MEVIENILLQVIHKARWRKAIKTTPSNSNEKWFPVQALCPPGRFQQRFLKLRQSIQNGTPFYTICFMVKWHGEIGQCIDSHGHTFGGVETFLAAAVAAATKIDAGGDIQ